MRSMHQLDLVGDQGCITIRENRTRNAVRNTIPIWRQTLFTPEAIPELRRSTVPTAKVEIAGLMRPLPTPPMIKPGNRTSQSAF